MTPMPPGDACGGGPRQTAHHSGPSLLYLTRTDLLSLGLEMTGIIDAVEAGIRGKGEGEAVMPPKLTLHGAGGAFSQAMAAALPQALGVKWVTIFPANAAAGLSVVNGLVIASDPATGLPVAVMDAGVVTAWRTGASVAVAARLLARRDVTGIGVLGCGTQARSSVAALAAVFPGLRAVRCHDVVPAAAAAFVADVGEALPGVELVVCSQAREVAQGLRRRGDRHHDERHGGAATRSPVSWRTARWRWPSTTTRRGPPRPWLPATASSATTRPRCWRRRRPARGSPASPARSPGTSASWLAGRVPGRLRDDERLFCMNLGLAVEDVVTARLALERARELGVGRELPL